MSADASIRVLALDGIPEIREGDDLGVFIGNAIQRTAGALPLTREDVLVVTQKIVSKAEGAVVDLTTVAPRREAIKFAERFDRDPRQVEVVLREARRVVRMQNGVLITETAHGFVCANGGIDASNVGPASGSVVTLLPVDPDGSATRIRTAIRARYGVDVPVVMSDSFGRPWRWGIVDIAIGVSGLLPLEDLRGIPDARWTRHEVDGSCRRRRAGIRRRAHAGQDCRPAGRAGPRRFIHPRRGHHPRRPDPSRERSVPVAPCSASAPRGPATALQHILMLDFSRRGHLVLMPMDGISDRTSAGALPAQRDRYAVHWHHEEKGPRPA